MQIDDRWFRAFPAAADVFVDPVSAYEKHLVPICSVNLQSIGGADEWLHMVCVTAHYDGCVGEDREAFHNDLTKEDHLAFRRVDGKYEFIGDFDYFVLNTDESGEWIDELRAIEQKNRATFNKVRASAAGQTIESSGSRRDILGDVGGQAPDVAELLREENITLEAYLRHANLAERSGLPTREDGSIMTYVAQASGYHFMDHAPSELMLFYDDTRDIAVQCFDYS